VKIIANHKMTGVEPKHQHLPNEICGRNTAHRVAKAGAVKDIDVMVGQRLVFFPKTHQPGGRIVTREKFLWRRFKTHDNRGPTSCPGDLEHPLQ
jgi:hypothetical protein